MHRNEIIFMNKMKDSEKVLNLVQIKTWMWITNKVSNVRFIYSDWCLCLDLCIKSIVE